MINQPLPASPGERIIPDGYAPGEVERWAYRRLPHERERPPWIGERVLFREYDFGPVVPARVIDVEDMTGTPHNHWHRHGGVEHLRGPGMPDPNVWEQHPAHGWRLKADPWPWVLIREVRIDDEGAELRDDEGNVLLAPPRWCREARVRGSVGWMRDGSRAHRGNYEND